MAAMRQVVRDRRRPLAAVLAGGAVLAGLASLQPAPAVTAPVLDPTRPVAGEVAIPVELSSQAAAALIAPGDRVDVVERVEGSMPHVIADRARVLGSSSGGFLAASSAVLLVAVSEETALRLAGATGELTALIQPPDGRPDGTPGATRSSAPDRQS